MTAPGHGSARRRVGVFGGTFDPPHIAHLVLATDVRHSLGLDTVLMVVAGEPWQKVGVVDVTPAADRLAMVRAAVRDVAGLEACALELERPGPTYSVDTLHELRRRHPGDELYLVLGADAAAGLDTWDRAEELSGLCRIVVVDRPGTPSSVPEGFDAQHVEAPRLDISSTELRSRCATGRSLRFLVPDGAISVIEERGLYAGGR